MKPTQKTRESFRATILDILTDPDGDDYFTPVIYAESIDGEMIFGSCQAAALGGHETVWMHVEADSFGEITGDHLEDTIGIEDNCYAQAVNDILEELENTKTTER